MNPYYIISDDNRNISCYIKSKGETCVGFAGCHPSDIPNLEFGKKLALYRAVLDLRKRDLIEIRLLKDLLKETSEDLPPTQTKLWIWYYQDTCVIEQRQLQLIKSISKKIRDLISE